MSNQRLTQEELKALLHYDPDTGELTWRITRSHNAKAGMRAGGVTKGGYRRIYINGVERLEHRLVFLYMTGRWPAEYVDHKDRNRSNNRWDNLRPASKSQNGMNSSLCPRNRSGTRGVSYSNATQRWIAKIGVKGRQKYLGSYREKCEAELAYKQAALKLHGEFSTVQIARETWNR